MEVNYEFNKLDTVDLKVARWLFSESPSELYGFLEYLSAERYKLRGIDLNVHKAFHDMAKVTLNDSAIPSQRNNATCGQ